MNQWQADIIFLYVHAAKCDTGIYFRHLSAFYCIGRREMLVNVSALLPAVKSHALVNAVSANEEIFS